jgi:uncharacterized repeat protein (TIGR01451 family)
VELADSLPAVTGAEVCEVTLLVDCTDDADFSAFTGPLTLGILAADASRTFVLRADVPASAAKDSTLVNEASVSTTTADPDPDNDSDDHSTTVDTSADLKIDKDGPAGVKAGDTISYTISVTNLGPSDSEPVTLTDTLPALMGGANYCTYDPAVNTTCTAAPPTWPGSIAVPALAPDGQFVVIIQKTISDTANKQTIFNEASVTCVAGLDPSCTNNTSATVSTAITALAVLLFIDEESIDNGRVFHANPNLAIHEIGQDITSSTSTKFTATQVNDGKASSTQRSILPYFAANVGKYITLTTGQTGDEGWFALGRIPSSWGTTSQQGLLNYFGRNGASAIPSASTLDKTPDVRPLRAKGLHMLEGQTVCAVVYDSDISINYGSKSPRLSGNLQGAVLGVVAFTVDVNGVHRLKGFSSSTLPEVRIKIESAVKGDESDVCGGLRPFVDAPAPASSSVPNDIDPHVQPKATDYPAP